MRCRESRLAACDRSVGFRVLTSPGRRLTPPRTTTRDTLLIKVHNGQLLVLIRRRQESQFRLLKVHVNAYHPLAVVMAADEHGVARAEASVNV